MATFSVVASGQKYGEPVRDALGDELRESFAGALQRGPHLEPTLNEALGYVLSHPGSMVRARLSLGLAMTYGAPKQVAKDLAIGLEYFHTASLLFDDLPCMDNAMMRRGARCVHLEYGQASTVLAALALINCAYGLVWGTMRIVPVEFQGSALGYLLERLGADGLLNGQSLDLNFKTNARGIAATERVARSKTVPLIELALVLPAMVGQAPRREIQLLGRLSLCWGLAYQLADDLKDVLGAQEQTGKSTSRDRVLGRPNSVLALGVPAAVDRLGRLIHAGNRTLDRLLGARPSLGFLREFRAGLCDELTQAIESAGAIPIDKPR